MSFRNSKNIVELASRRFREEDSGKGILKEKTNVYEEIIKSFVAKRNCVNDYLIARVEKSKNAFPISILKEIQGETTMPWTGFAAKMKDGKYVGFGTQFSTEFFEMPESYSVEDIEKIINHSYVLKTGELRSHTVPFFQWPDDYDEAIVYRERPFFECYMDDL